ncbi:alpha/beta fold hydrolase [Cohnella lubricantis]|uniref:Alpha/beta fold hydrolase n=2 Tax=Cohnella lubricantis TaxID=2163172 RepID=A0A841TB15_9BACL|nr:alpha/beta fold hydrolase [Cohnella lubricantis]MBB6678192.1 alpha/beta fold hydrolase [Cohnella lubricantis]
MQAYDYSLSLWKVPAESRYVDTSFGKTHVLAAGPEHAEPILLFHGFAFSSTVWLENIEALSARYRVYAVDFPGDINKSEASRPICSKQECADWAEELMDGLGVQKVHLLGHSFGGFIAMILAARLTSRVRRLIVLSPGGGVLPQGKGFFLRCLLAGMFPSSKRIHRLMDYMTGKGNTIHPALKEQFVTAMQNALPRTKLFVSNMRDEELKRLLVPTLLLIGDQEIQYDAQAAARRAESTMPSVEAVIVKDAGHGLPLERPDEVNALMLAFLERRSGLPQEHAAG